MAAQSLSRRIFKWGPPIAWMWMIFSASGAKFSGGNTSRFFIPFVNWLFPGITEERVHLLHFLARKAGHLTGYAVLAMLLWSALSHLQGSVRMRWALMLTMLYAATDEFHQSLVPGRDGAVADVLLDTVGGFLGLMLIWLAQKWWRGRRAVAENPSLG